MSKGIATEELTRKLDELFRAERQVRTLHAELAGAGPSRLVPALEPAVGQALAHGQEEERALRLVRLAALLGESEGPRAVDLLVDILGSDEPEARRAAGEALEDLAFDRFKEVALGIERALERLPAGNPALVELPYLLAEVAEPGCLKLLGQFLASRDAETVAAAIEGLAELGDPAAAPMLAVLEGDRREVQLEDDEGEEGKITLGELAHEARELLARGGSPPS